MSSPTFECLTPRDGQQTPARRFISAPRLPPGDLPLIHELQGLTGSDDGHRSDDARPLDRGGSSFHEEGVILLRQREPSVMDRDKAPEGSGRRDANTPSATPTRVESRPSPCATTVTCSRATSESEAPQLSPTSSLNPELNVRVIVVKPVLIFDFTTVTRMQKTQGRDARASPTLAECRPRRQTRRSPASTGMGRHRRIVVLSHSLQLSPADDSPQPPGCPRVTRHVFTSARG